MGVFKKSVTKITLLKINIFIYGEYTIQIARQTKRLALDIHLDCIEVLFKMLAALIQLFIFTPFIPRLHELVSYLFSPRNKQKSVS